MRPASPDRGATTSVRSDHYRILSDRHRSDRHRVVLAVHAHTMLLELAIAAEVFGVDRSDLSPDGRWYTLAAWTPDGRPTPWLPDVPTCTLDDLRVADTIVVPSTDDPAADTDPALRAALRGAHERGTRIVALCTGAFVLADAGLLDGRAAATHWMHAELGLRPLDWLHRERLALAQELLESSDATVEQIASRCGLGTAATLRRHFRRTVGASPTTYRATFGRTAGRSA